MSETLQSLNQVKTMTDQEMVDNLVKNAPELKEEALFLMQCPERIGLEPLRDILVYKVKTWKQSSLVVKALVTGIRAGLGYSLRDQHKTYVELFNDMKNVLQESTKLITDVSHSIGETLKNENKESGKTLSALKEVLGNAHELTKILVEGKSHGHLQAPPKPKRPKTPEHFPTDPQPTTSKKEPEPKGIKVKIKESMNCMRRENFTASVDCTKGDIRIKTIVCSVDYVLLYNEEDRRWNVEKAHKKDEHPQEL